MPRATKSFILIRRGTRPINHNSGGTGQFVGRLDSPRGRQQGVIVLKSVIVRRARALSHHRPPESRESLLKLMMSTRRGVLYMPVFNYPSAFRRPP
jgi:hypothetical protein